jgi:hypothetical protein
MHRQRANSRAIVELIKEEREILMDGAARNPIHVCKNCQGDSTKLIYLFHGRTKQRSNNQQEKM